MESFVRSTRARANDPLNASDQTLVYEGPNRTEAEARERMAGVLVELNRRWGGVVEDAEEGEGSNTAARGAEVEEDDEEDQAGQGNITLPQPLAPVAPASAPPTAPPAAPPAAPAAAPPSTAPAGPAAAPTAQPVPGGYPVPNRNGQYTTAVVNAHPHLNFWHKGRGFWEAGLPPPGSMPMTAVRGPGAAGWKRANTAR